MKPSTDLDVLWRHRRGFNAAYRQLIAYAHSCIKRRSTGTPGGRQIAQLEQTEVVNGAIVTALSDPECPADGEELFRLVRRNIDNSLRTLEKSPRVVGGLPIQPGAGVDGVIGEDALPDRSTPDPSAQLLENEEQELKKSIVEETRRRLKSPHCLEARLLSLLLEGAGDKLQLCARLNVDGAKFDRLKHSLKNVAASAAADLRKKAKS